MTEAPRRSGNRALATLLLLLLAAIGLVVWLALRTPAPDKPAPPKQKPAPQRPREEPVPQPRTQRPRGDEGVRLAPTVAAEPPPRDTDAEDEGAKPVAIDVHVLRVDGSNAAGADVILLDPFAQHVASPRKPELARKKTDEQGMAHFSVGNRVVRIHAWMGEEAASTDKIEARTQKGPVTVRLETALAVHGRIVEAAGVPVAGALARLTVSPYLQDPFGLVLEALTGEDGRFVLPSVPEAAVKHLGGADRAAVIEGRAKGYPATRQFLHDDDLRGGEIVLELQKGALLRGRCVRSSGQVVEGEEIRTIDGRSSVVSGDDGRFELPLPREGAIVLALRRVPNLRDVQSSAKTGYGAPKLLGRFRGDGEDLEAGDIVLVEGKPVKGRVVEIDEKPVAAGDVVLYLAGVSVASTQTGDDGRFEIDGIGDDAHVLQALEAPTGKAWTGRRKAVVEDVRGGGDELRVVLTGALSVYVRFLAAADNTPVVVPEVSLRAKAVGETPETYGWSWAGGGIESVRFEVEEAGRFTVTVELPGYEPATSEPFDVSAEREVRIDVLFRKKP